MRLSLLVFFALGLVACEPTKKSPSSQPADFANKPMTPGDLVGFEKLIQSVGRFEHSYLATVSNDTLLDEMRSAVQGALASGICSEVGSYKRPDRSNELGADGKAKRQRFSVTGDKCPIFANILLSQTRQTPTFWFGSGDWLIANPSLAAKNEIRKLSFRLLRSDLRKSGDLMTIDTQLDTAASNQTGVVANIRAQTQMKVRTVGAATLMTGTRSLEVFDASGNRKVQLLALGDGTATLQYFLNTDRISAEQYDSYLSALGPLVSGFTSEAG